MNPMQFPTGQTIAPLPRRPHPLVSRSAVALYGLVVGLVFGAVGGCSGAASDAAPPPAPTVTVTSAPQETPTSSAPTTAGYSPRVSEWNVQLKVTKKTCFGEVGCNVTVSIHPQYVGDRDLPTTGEIDVTYEISGDESGPLIRTFTVTEPGDQVSYDRSAMLSTASSDVTPRSKITDVTYSE